MSLKIYDNGDRNSNKIALTFDDGPNPFWTEKILDILDQYDVKANFFLVGQYAKQYEDIVKKIYTKGHLIGNHTYSHSKTAPKEFEKAEEIIFSITGVHTKFIRPPYLRAELEICQSYKPAQEGTASIVNCDVGVGDWDQNKKAKDLLRAIERNVQNGSVILFHDGGQRQDEQKLRPKEMVKALPEVLRYLKKRFTIVRLDAMNLIPAEAKIPMKPNFFIIGAQKAATTFIQHCLSGHPEVFMAPGEVAYFQDPDYHKKSIEEFENIFYSAGGKKVVGIKRPDYLAKPEVPARIHEHYPDAKLLVVLRNPIERAIVDYFHNINYGFIPPKNIEVGMRKLLKGEYKDSYKRSSEIIEYGFYCKHLKHYLEYFKRDQIHVILFDDIKNNPMKVFRETFDFLGIRNDYVPKGLDERPQSVTYSIPRLRILALRNVFLYEYNQDRTRLEIKKSNPVRKFFVRVINKLDRVLLSKVFNSGLPALSPSLKQELVDVYKKDVECLSGFLRIDLSDWLT